MVAPAALRRHIERSVSGKHFTKTRDVGHRLALRFIRVEFAVEPALRNLREGDGRAPGVGPVLPVDHCGLACAGTGNCQVPPSSATSSSCASLVIAVSA